MNYYFQKNNYFHQNFSIVFVIIVDTILLIVISILKNDDNKNIYTTKNIYICIFIILIYIILSFSLSFAKVNVKYFYEYKNINQYKTITCIGIIGFILIIFFSIFLSILGKKEECEKPSLNFYCYDKISYYFRDLKNRLYGNNKTQFFLEIFVITPLYIFLNFISFTCEILTITYLNPNYLILSENIHYGTLRLFLLYLNPSFAPLKKIIFLELADVVEFIGCIIYLEIIEIKLYGLDKNTKKNISLRGENEVICDLLNNDDDNESEKSFENI
jgi:ABC-type multidrug transport system fused ATPase/permease subunit